MNRTLGLTAATCVALGAIHVTTSWWLGQHIEQEHQRQLERVLAVLGPDKLVSNTYERGLFSSTATLVLQLKEPPRPSSSPDADDRVIRLHLTQDLQHGPWAGGRLAAAAVQTQLLRVEGLDETAYDVFAGVKPPVLNTVHGFNRAVTGQLKLPAGEIKDPSDPSGKNRIHWDVLRHDFDIDAARTRIRSQAQWPLLAVSIGENSSSGHLQMRLTGFESRSEQQLNGGQWLMPPGQQEGTLSRLEIKLRNTSSDTPDLDVQLYDMRMDSRTRQTDAVLGTKQHVSGKAKIGPLSFENLSIEAELQRIDARVLAELQHMMITAFKATASSDEAPKAPDFEQIVNRLLAASPELKERLSLTMGGETASFGYGLKIDPSISASADDMPAAMAWAERLKVDASMTVPRSLVKAIADLVNHPEMPADTAMTLADMVAAQGYLKRTDTGWTTEAALVKGSLTVNGKPIFDNYGIGLLSQDAVANDALDEQEAPGVE
ncbi:MAG: YdgA family protein [Lautropia sp.]|nr:YdgA family protein [Lautropia sp.]